MIDWVETSKKHGNVDLTKYRPKVVVKCDKCNKLSDYTIRVKSKVVDNNIKWLCTKCACNKDSVKNKLRESTKRSWNSEEYIKKQKDKSRKLWNDENYRKKHDKSVTTESSRKKCSEAAINAWKRSDYREKHAVALAKQLNVMPNTERRVHSILDSMKIKYDTNYVVGPYTFDVLIRRHGDPDILIEVNGNYWHTRPYVMRKDSAKSSYIADIPQYILKTVWEHQLFDLERCKHLICNWLGINDNRRDINLKGVRFNKCSIGEMREFMSNFHYLGSMGRAGLHICGMFGDDIVCGAVFAHPTRKESYESIGSKSDVLELTRFCISPYIKCKNLASYALSNMIKFVPDDIKYIISFASPGDGHDGTIYKASNWEFISDTKESYFYINNEGWKMHKKTLYNQARGVHMRESEFAKKYNYRKIWLPPLKKFLKKLNKT